VAERHPVGAKGDFIMDQKKEPKAKKEKKFNSERVGRQVKASLNEVFPYETFIVSTLVEKVEVLYPSTSKVTAAEINIYKKVFCALAKVKKEELAFSQFEKKAV
jgi:hypothetical protein